MERTMGTTNQEIEKMMRTLMLQAFESGWFARDTYPGIGKALAAYRASLEEETK
jgi:hypothetical protein